MKKTIFLFVLLFSFVVGFSYAQEFSNISNQQMKISQKMLKAQLFTGQKLLNKKENKASSGSQYSGTLSGNKKLPTIISSIKKDIKSLSGIQNIFKKPVCITGDKLVVRDSLSKKALEASQKLSSLVETSSKIGYDTKKITALTKNLQNLSSQIAKDCLPADFQQHREQIKTALASLKTEIQLFKQYVARLRAH